MASVSLRKCLYRNETLAILRKLLFYANVSLRDRDICATSLLPFYATVSFTQMSCCAIETFAQRDTCHFTQRSRCAIVATVECLIFFGTESLLPKPIHIHIWIEQAELSLLLTPLKKELSGGHMSRWWLKSSRRAITLFWAGNNSHGTCDLFIKQPYRATNENETSATDCAAAAHTFILFCVLEIIVVVFLKKYIFGIFSFV